MSGIYIPGMKMPKLGYREIRIHHDGNVTENPCPEYSYEEKISKAIPVPDHGRLIDADALEADIFQLDWRTGEEYAVGFSEQAIDKAPTIIPADKEGER